MNVTGMLTETLVPAFSTPLVSLARIRLDTFTGVPTMPGLATSRSESPRCVVQAPFVKSMST